ncbi:hypothetical protein NC651_011223 [Populus alba x Populus x berolinensis]|nr:hypothetical protein NC651_011223 [Populus alba x Populus x berolinensis]
MSFVEGRVVLFLLGRKIWIHGSSVLCGTPLHFKSFLLLSVPSPFKIIFTWYGSNEKEKGASPNFYFF